MLKKYLVMLVCVCLLLCIVTFVSADTIKIGANTCLTGYGSADGLSSSRGMELAVKLINDAGGINGNKIELIVYDDKAESKEALEAGHRLIEKDKIVAAIGASYSTPSRALAPLFDSKKIPYIVAYATHPEISTNKKYVIAMGVYAELHGRSIAKVAFDKLHAKTASILYVDAQSGAETANEFKKYASKLGIDILSEDKFPFGEIDFRSVLNNIKNNNPDVLVALAFYQEGALIVKQAKEIGLKATIISYEGMDSPMLFELGGEATNGTIITTTLNRDSDNALTRKFLEEYRNAYGVEADMVAAGCFDAVELLAFAIKQSGTDADAIIETIANLKNYENAVTGPFIRFDDQHNVIRVIVAEIVRDQAFHHFYTIDDPEYITP